MTDPVFDIFREEAREHLSALEKAFLDLETAEATDARRELVDHAFRHAHSMKSDAKVVGLNDLKKAAQILEDILDELRENPDTINREKIDGSLKQFDKVRAAFDAWQNVNVAQPAPTAPPAGNETVDAGRASDEDRESGAPPPENIPAVSKRPAAEAKPVAPEHPSPERHSPERPPPEAPVVAAATEERFTVRVPSERLDRMLNLAGEVRISQRSADALAERLEDLSAQVAQSPIAELQLPSEMSEEIKSAIGNRQSAILDHIRRIQADLRKKRSREELLTEALEADIRQARLLPLVMLTDSLRRVVRDLAQSLGKSIRYEADVGKILLDKAVIESLKDPLMHLVRNAADHGIEPPAARLAAGKPEEAVIRVHAERRGELVRITVADDGRGVDYGRIRQRLRQSGELDEVELSSLTEEELSAYLFRPGFSTAPAGEVSGRGVGLDVVRDTVRRLQGNVQLASSSADGTNFAIMVPVTISSVRILTVVAGGQNFGIPSTAIHKTGRASRKELRELEGCLVLPVDGQPVRWVHLVDLLGNTASQSQRNGQTYSYLLVTHQGGQTAVVVDDLDDEAEVLLKPLGFPLSGLPGIVGATIRADGSVQLVLDLANSVLRKAEAGPSPSPARQKAPGRILVVDDSPTTRAVLRNVFTAAGYAVRTATDGVNALDHLRSQPVDLVISDVEMPRLNGIDLTRQIKAKFGLPVILVTGREKEQHRREGLEAGADAYVVKSTFEDQGLLEIVKQFV